MNGKKGSDYILQQGLQCTYDEDKELMCSLKMRELFDSNDGIKKSDLALIILPQDGPKASPAKLF